MKDTIARRRSVLNSVVRQVAEQLPLEGADHAPIPLPTATAAWKKFFAGIFYHGFSSEDVIRRDNWNETVLAIEAWACRRGVTFENREDKA